MASTPFFVVASGVDLTTVFQTLFTVPTNETLGIDAAVFNNYATTNADITVRLIKSGVGGVLDEVVTDRTIRAKESFLAPAMIGQALQTGGKIQAKASVNSRISAHITGTIVTS